MMLSDIPCPAPDEGRHGVPSYGSLSMDKVQGVKCRSPHPARLEDTTRGTYR
jgi:hypothetical protein